MIFKVVLKLFLVNSYRSSSDIFKEKEYMDTFSNTEYKNIAFYP